jgi:hypothetical protein
LYSDHGKAVPPALKAPRQTGAVPNTDLDSAQRPKPAGKMSVFNG